MSKEKPTPQEAYEARGNIRRFTLKCVRSTDKDIIEKLESEDNMQGYLKNLIREDIARNQK